MPLYFIRHGESHANEQNRFAGRLNTPLTELGLRQARQAAEQVVALDRPIDDVHVSTLGRARQTADVIIARLPQAPAHVTFSDALVERDFGIFSGRNKSLVKKSIGFSGYTESFHSHTGSPPGGESWAAMYQRIAEYYRDVLLPASELGRTVLVVAHKYIIEMFAMVVGGVPVQEYRDLKIPNARPLSENDLRRAASAPAAAALVNDLGEVVEIRLPLMVASAAILGVVTQLLVGVHIPPWVFSSVMTALLAIGSFFAMLRVDPAALRGVFGSIRPAVPLLLPRLALGLVILWAGNGLVTELVGLFLLLPPAMIVPSLSLLWGGDYFLAVRHTVAASLLLPVVLLAGVVLRFGLPTAPGSKFGTLAPALLTYALVLLTALAMPGLSAQALRWRNPIRAGAISTNWNWLGGLALVPLAGFATFALTPATGLTQHGRLSGLLTVMAVTSASLAVLRLLSTVVLQLWRSATGLDRDIFITQNTPNVFLWLAMTAVLAPSTGSHPSVIGLGVALVFFLAIYVDELVFRYGHSRDLKVTERSLWTPDLAMGASAR
jgi:broad specificity phosphatase PhoE